MDKIQIEPISPSNVDSVVQLFQERNDTLPANTHRHSQKVIR
jgi:hypothetical protein